MAEDPKLNELHPKFALQIKYILHELAALGFQPKIAEGLRDWEQQQEKIRKGVSRANYSRHLVGLAVDIVDKRWGWNGPAAKPNHPFWVSLGQVAKAYHLTWGGDWNIPGVGPDVAHVEWPGLTWRHVKAQLVEGKPIDLPKL